MGLIVHHSSQSLPPFTLRNTENRTFPSTYSTYGSYCTLILTKSLVKDKANHAVVLDKATSDKLAKDVQSYRLITVATLVDRLNINGSLARMALKDLEEKGQIKKVVGHSRLSIYSALPFSIISTSSYHACRLTSCV